MINYDSIIKPGERIVARGKLHVGAFVVPLVIMLIGAAVVFLDLGQSMEQFKIIGAAVTIVGVWATLKALSMRLTTQFVLTDERLLAESGLLKHRNIELPIRQIERVEVRNSLLGSVLGYGTLEVTGRDRLRERYSQITGANEISDQALKLMTGPPKVMPYTGKTA